jgi:hypothetical protein
MDNIRKGKGFRWSEEVSSRDGQSRTIDGFTIDNLDTKKISEASNNYEKLFILVRELLEKNEAASMDDQTDRLQCCQTIADTIKERGLLK